MAKPEKAGTEAVISVSAKMADGRTQEMGKGIFKVKLLPDPKPYLTIAGIKFDGGRISRAELMSVNVAEAGIDDGILNIPFTVRSFEVSTMDNTGVTVKRASDGASFSADQKELIRSSRGGKTVLIRGMVVRSPSGEERTLKYPLEIIITN